MAGFDFEYDVPLRYRDDAKQWMSFFQRLAKEYNLDVAYRITDKTARIVNIYCAVAGQRFAIQQLERSMQRESFTYALARGREATIRRQLLSPFSPSF
jgi:hypothetical protein